MKRFITGVSRTQGALFPEALDDFISEENVIRVVEAFIDELDLESLSFDTGLSKMTGRPGGDAERGTGSAGTGFSA